VGGVGGMSTPHDDNGDEVGPTYEVVISCTRYVSAQTEIKTHIVACGLSRECLRSGRVDACTFSCDL